MIETMDGRRWEREVLGWRAGRAEDPGGAEESVGFASAILPAPVFSPGGLAEVVPDVEACVSAGPKGENPEGRSEKGETRTSSSRIASSAAELSCPSWVWIWAWSC
jgi:hypothetical protein